MLHQRLSGWVNHPCLWGDFQQVRGSPRAAAIRRGNLAVVGKTVKATLLFV
jgi:hypothetical protein